LGVWVISNKPSSKQTGSTDSPTEECFDKSFSAEGTGLWKYRPFSRVVRGYKAYRIVRDYVQLNEKEITGQIPYRKQRLKGLSSSEWEALWR
jgi:hypothetical protein